MSPTENAPKPTRRVDDPLSRALQRRWNVATAAAVALFAFAIGVGFWGIPFGSHWDEWYAQRGSEKALNRLDLFPGDFTYNGLYFDLAFVPLVDDVVEHLPPIFEQIQKAPTRPLEPEKYPAIAEMQKKLIPMTQSEGYVHAARRLFCAITLLMVLFLFFAARAVWPMHPAAAVVAAAVTATSWELGYHARYIAADALMASFAALMFWCIFEARRADDVLRPVRAQLLWAIAAIAGGLAFGGKVTGLFFCLPIGLGALLSPPRPLSFVAVAQAPLRTPTTSTAATAPSTWLVRRARAVLVELDLRNTGLLRLRRCAFTAVIFVVTFLLTTPGFLRDPVRFAAGVFHTAATYNLGKFAYATHELGDHLSKLYGWLFLRSTAPFIAGALVLAVLAVVGAVHLARRRRVEAVLLLTFFASWSTVLLRAQQLSVRNALALLPVVILCIAGGVVVVGSRGPRVRFALALVLAVVFASSAAHDVYAAWTIHNTTKQSIRQDAIAWLNEHDDRALIVGPKLHKAIGAELAARYSCEARGRMPASDARVALFFSEHDRFKWRSNTIGFYEKQFAAMETNLERYANWRGRHRTNRITVLSVENARENHIKMRRWLLCTPKSSSSSSSSSASSSAAVKTKKKRGAVVVDAGSAPAADDEPDDIDEPSEPETQSEREEREREEREDAQP